MSVAALNAFLAGVDPARAGNEEFLKFVEAVLARNDVTTIEQLAEVTADTISYEGIGSVSAGVLLSLLLPVRFMACLCAGKRAFINKAIVSAKRTVPAQDVDDGELCPSDSEEVDDNVMQAALLKALGVKHPKEYVSVDIGKQLDELHLSVCRCALLCKLA